MTIWLGRSHGYESKPEYHASIGGRNPPHLSATSSCPITLKVKRQSNTQSVSVSRRRLALLENMAFIATTCLTQRRKGAKTRQTKEREAAAQLFSSLTFSFAPLRLCVRLLLRLHAAAEKPAARAFSSIISMVLTMNGTSSAHGSRQSSGHLYCVSRLPETICRREI